MGAAGYNAAPSLTQHLNFPQQPSLLPQPWGAAGLAAAAESAQSGANSSACSEHLYRGEDPYRRMPPGLEASLATAAEWSSSNAWDASAAPSWLILSACSGRSNREAHGHQAQSAANTLSPLAQRAADAAVRVAAGLLSPGRWKAPQAVGVSSIAALHNSASLPKNFAPYKSTYKAMSPAKAPLSRSISNGSDEYGRPKKNAGRVQPGASGTLEGSITALADALSSLEAGMPPDMARQLDFEPLDLEPILDAQGELTEARPASPSSVSNGSGEQITSYSSGSLAGAELMDEPFLDSLSSHSGVLDAAEPTEEWLSTSSDWLASSDGEVPLSSVPGHAEPSAEAFAATEQGQDFQDASVTFEQAFGSIDNLGFHEARAPLEPLPELPLEEDAAARSDSLDADMAPAQQPEWPCSTPVQKRGESSLNAPENNLCGNSRLWRSVSDPFCKTKQLPTWAPGMEGAPMETPFAGSCAESPFEAPSPRDMQLSPAEEQLIPASGLSKDMEPVLEQASSHPRSPVLVDRSKTEQLLWMPDVLPTKHTLERSRSAGSCAAQANARLAGKRLFGIVGEDQSEWQPLLRESSQVMEMVGMDTEWMLNDLLACADAVYA